MGLSADSYVRARGHFARKPRSTEFICTVNLSLPTGTLHATAEGPDPVASARKAFVELEAQIKKHQSRLRKEYEWKRKRGKVEQSLA